jgi:hypothetical protein
MMWHRKGNGHATSGVVFTAPRCGRLQHPEPCSMVWPDCDCTGCVLREISQAVWVGLFSSWGEWPRERADGCKRY